MRPMEKRETFEDENVLFKKMLRLEKEENFEAAIEIGENLIADKVSPLLPKVYGRLGIIYALLDKNDDENTPNRKKSWQYFLAAEKAGGLDNVEEIARVTSLSDYLPIWYHVYRILADTLKKIDVGTFPKPNYSTHIYLWKRAAYCASQAGLVVEAFEYSRESWERAEGASQKAICFGNLLLYAQNMNFNSQDLFDLHRMYGDIFKNLKPYAHDLTARKEEIRRTKRRIRIGYISPDCRIHVALRFFVGLLQYADREKFEVFMYALNEQKDIVTDKVREIVEHFVDVSGMSHEKIAAKIRDDGIDILTDLAGHTSNSPLPVLAYKPAPVQMSGIGYLATTGLPAVDYYITDEIVDPPGAHEEFFTEKLLYLTSQFSAIPALVGKIPDILPSPCLKNNFVTFGIFNHYRKITDEMISLWQKILSLVPTSRLLLKCMSYEDEEIAAMAAARFQKLGIDTERVTFEKADGDYLARYRDIDIALDTYPYTGGGTTLDALYMGVPVITLYGERRNTRFSLSLLQNVGLRRLAADSGEKYVILAATLAKDMNFLNELHQKIRPMAQNSIVGRPDKYTAELEQRYLEIMEIHG